MSRPQPWPMLQKPLWTSTYNGTLTVFSEVSPWLYLPKEMSKLNFEDPDFMLLMFTRNHPKRGSGFYHNWSKLMKKNWMTFRRVAQQSVMPCTCPWTLLDWTSSTVSPYECPWWKSLFEVWKLYHTWTARNMSMQALGLGSVQRGHGIWIWISIIEKFLLSFEIYTLHGLPQTCAWVWKSVCLLSGVHFACLPTPDPLHAFAKLVTSILPTCQIHTPLVHDVAKFTHPLSHWELCQS